MRLAWFSPLPPATTGIAAYSADLLPRLPGHAIDLFVDPTEAATAQAPFGCHGPFPARDFVWRNVRQPYDLVVYQLGNSPAHDYMWPYVARFPGLVVLHDAQVHHSRALALLTAGRHDDYRAEFAFCHPDARPGVADAVISATAGSLFYLWPLNRVPIESARMVAVHTPGLASLLRDEFANVAVEVVRMGVSDPGEPASAGSRKAAQAIRARHGLNENTVVFAAFGMVTPEKRIAEALRAMKDALRTGQPMHLLLVGQAVDHYDARADARHVGVEDHVSITGYVGDDDLRAYLHAADVCLSMRWPSSRETSAAWLRCLAAGRPTIITDLVHTTDVPVIDPRTWQPLERVWLDETRGDAGPASPVAVAIDILDEQHSLGLAMRRLAIDAPFRAALGRNARAFWRSQHTVARMADDYNRVVALAAERPLPDRAHLPPHVIGDGSAHAREILSPFGLGEDRLGWNG
ncbi:MAG: glycosyltransferase family 4 protein [Bacteroidales bacterium]